jgi:hypothetical protein
VQGTITACNCLITSSGGSAGATHLLKISGEIPRHPTEKKCLWGPTSLNNPFVEVWCKRCNKPAKPRDVVPNAQFRVLLLWKDHENTPCTEWPLRLLKESDTKEALTLSEENPHEGAKLLKDLTIVFPAADDLETAVPDVVCTKNAGNLSKPQTLECGVHQESASSSATSTKAKSPKQKARDESSMGGARRPGMTQPAQLTGKKKHNSKKKKDNSKKKDNRTTKGQQKNKLMVLGFMVGTLSEGTLSEGERFERDENVEVCYSNAFTVQNPKSTNKKKKGTDIRLPASHLIALVRDMLQRWNACTGSEPSCPDGSTLENTSQSSAEPRSYSIAHFTLTESDASIIRATMQHCAMPELAVWSFKRLPKKHLMLILIYKKSGGRSEVCGAFNERVVAVALGSDGREMVLNVSHVKSTPLGTMFELAHALAVQKFGPEGNCILLPLMENGKEVQKVKEPYQVYITGRLKEENAPPFKSRQGQAVSSDKMKRLHTVAELLNILRDSGIQMAGSSASQAHLFSEHYLKAVGV